MDGGMADSICILYVCRPLAPFFTWSKWKARFIQQSFGLRRHSFLLFGCHEMELSGCSLRGCPHDAMKFNRGLFYSRPLPPSLPSFLSNLSFFEEGGRGAAGARERKNMIDVRGDTISHFLPALHFFRSSLPLSPTLFCSSPSPSLSRSEAAEEGLQIKG